jgi:argininosuccinate synthase
LAYAGGLDTTVAVPWLAEQYHAEVVTLTLDLGQGQDLALVRERALAAGAARAHVLDVRAEFADGFILPALQAGALYEGRYPLTTALGRPLLASKLVEIARIEGTTLVAHCCTGKGNDQIRIDVSARALEPSTTVIAPARHWTMTVDEQVEYARSRGIAATAPPPGAYTVDTNLWGRSIQSGALEDPWAEPPSDVFALTADQLACPTQPAYVEIAFDQGIPTALNGVTMPFLDLIATLSTIAGDHGVGRLDLIENRLVGIKTREVYEAPAAVVLHQAHAELESFVSPRNLSRLKAELAVTYADLVYDGLWYSPVREALDGFMARVQEKVTGTIRVKLFKGAASMVGRQSPFALYDRELATYGDGDTFDHRAAEGFIRLWGLPVETAARRWRTGGRPARPKENS